MNTYNTSPATAHEGVPAWELGEVLLDVSYSADGYRVGRYLEHLEEASFLYEQWLYLPEEPDVLWTDLADVEDRFEAHLDALVLGGPLALRVAIQQAQEGDMGELHTAVCLFCRHRRLDLVEKAVEALEPDDEERSQAVAEALKQEMPDDWDDAAMDWVRAGGLQTSVGIQVAGYRRLEAGFALLKYLGRWEPARQAEALRSLGRLQYQPATAMLQDTYLQEEEPLVQAAAAQALLRMGVPQVLAYATRVAHTHPWAWIVLGLGGSRTDVSTLVAAVKREPIPAECIWGLGLLGDVSALPLLLPMLEDDAQAAHAATALNLITGADLYDEVFVPDEIDEDELLDEEREQLLRGESLYPPDETPPGITPVKLSQNPARWQAWWTANQGAFRFGVRYRNGEPCRPASLLQNLTSPHSTHQVRQWAADELVIRYRWDAVFEVDMKVSRQQDILQQAVHWAAAQDATFIAGRWYFAGRTA